MRLKPWSKENSWVDKGQGLVYVIVAVALIIIVTLQVQGHFQGKANHQQGQDELTVLHAQADFGQWLVESTYIDHATVCKVAAQRGVVCPPLPPLPKELLPLAGGKK